MKLWIYEKWNFISHNICHKNKEEDCHSHSHEKGHSHAKINKTDKVDL